MAGAGDLGGAGGGIAADPDDGNSPFAGGIAVRGTQVGGARRSLALASVFRNFTDDSGAVFARSPQSWSIKKITADTLAY